MYTADVARIIFKEGQLGNVLILDLSLKLSENIFTDHFFVLADHNGSLER
jgi:hypothetical protein